MKLWERIIGELRQAGEDFAKLPPLMQLAICSLALALAASVALGAHP